jgi:hypothetical protein
MPKFVPSALLANAESVQVNVILQWLQDLATELRRVGKKEEAALYLRKALNYLSGEKGEALAQVRDKAARGT